MEYIIQDKQQYQQYQEEFRTLSRAKKAMRIDHILYNLIRGKDLKRGFTPITRESKLNAHYTKSPWLAFNVAKNDLEWEIKSKRGEFRSRYPSITEEQWTLLLAALEGGK